MKIFGKHIIIYLLTFLTIIITVKLNAALPVDDAMLNSKINIMNLVDNNNYLLQSMIVLLVVMIFGYIGKLYYEKKIKKE